MVARRIDEAARAMSATIMPGAGAPSASAAVFRGAAIDSRRITGGELFFALAGEHTDGHRFVGAAFSAGAAAAVVSDAALTPPADRFLLRVSDPYHALHDLTRSVRREVPEKLVGITGSTGKTTTKELAARVLARRFRVAKSPGNLNNRLGFPLALLGVPDDTEWMVAEMGMSEPGELADVSRLARPDIAILLNVRPVHLERLGSLAAIAEAKSEILAGLAEGGLILANADDPEVVRVVERHLAAQPACRAVWFGAAPRASVRAESVRELDDRPGTRFTLVAPDTHIEIELPLHGRYNVDNALAAAALGIALGVPASNIAAALAEAAPATGRGEIYRLGDVTLVDDSYNSNPVALSKALESARALQGSRHIAILGEMLELGPEAPTFHAQAGREAAEKGFNPVVGVGELSSALVEAARSQGAGAQWFPNASEAALFAIREVAPGDVILVKGSRGIGLEVVVRALQERLGGAH